MNGEYISIETAEKIARLEGILKEIREILNKDYYEILRVSTIKKLREILDKEYER